MAFRVLEEKPQATGGFRPLSPSVQEKQIVQQPPVQQEKGGILSRISQKSGEAGIKFRKRMEGFAEATERGEQTVAEQVFQTAGAGLTGVGEAVGALVPETVTNIFGKMAKPMLENKDTQTVIGEWSKLIKDLETNDPRLARNLTATLENTLGVLGAVEAPGMVNLVAKTAVKTVPKVATAVETATKAKKSIAESLRINPRKMEEILAVPADKVKKLPINEQKVWYDNKKDLLKKETSEMTEQASKHFKEASEQATKQFAEKKSLLSENTKKAVSEYEKEAVKLERELAETARDKVIELRPKIIEGMRRQSDTYRKLVDDAMADKKDLTIDKDDFKSFIDEKFAEDDFMANAVKQRLGLVEQVDPLSVSGAKVGLEMRKTTTTIGEMHQKTKDLRQTVSKSPTRAYTPKDKITDDAIDTMLSYMKQNGVDLSEANQFWARYAPIRNKMIREAKPFIQSGIETKTFAKTLERVAKGADVNNEVFIGEVEEILGESITDDLRQVIGKIDDVEKRRIATEMQKKLDELDLEAQEEAIRKGIKESDEKTSKYISTKKEQELKRIKDVEFETNRIARRRQVIKDFLKLIIPSAVGGAAIGAFN